MVSFGYFIISTAIPLRIIANEYEIYSPMMYGSFKKSNKTIQTIRRIVLIENKYFKVEVLGSKNGVMIRSGV